MAGYMGFGMARWIYTQRPRKAFSKGRSKPSCNTLPTFNRKFKLQPSKRSDHLFIVMSLLLIGLLCFTVYSKSPKIVTHSQQIELQKKGRELKSKNDAFDFLMRSGIGRLQSNNLEGAYSEFKLAFKINPNHDHLNRLMIQTLSILCKEQNSYCNELDILLSNSI